jgi:hypothetical protein
VYVVIALMLVSKLLYFGFPLSENQNGVAILRQPLLA